MILILDDMGLLVTHWFSSQMCLELFTHLEGIYIVAIVLSQKWDGPNGVKRERERHVITLHAWRPMNSHGSGLS